MNLFERIDLDQLPDAAPEEHDTSTHCTCQIEGPHRDVVVDIDQGHILVIVCALCGLPVLTRGSEDDFDGVYTNSLRMRMTESREERDEGGYEGYHQTYTEYFYELTASEGEVSA